MKTLKILILSLMIGLSMESAKADLVGSQSLNALVEMYTVVVDANNVLQRQCQTPHSYNRDQTELAYRRSREMMDLFRDALGRYLASRPLAEDHLRRVINASRRVLDAAYEVRRYVPANFSNICAAVDEIPHQAIERALQCVHCYRNQ